VNSKQVVGLVILSLGVVLTIFSFHSMGVIEKKELSPIITNSPISPTERLPDREDVVVGVGENNCRAHFILLGAIAMVVIGAGVAVYYRK
jgi:hypothetical protein